MKEDLEVKIENWVHQELDIKEPLSFNYFMNQATLHGFTTDQILNYLVQELVNGRYYEPSPNKIARVPLPFSHGRRVKA